MPPCKILIVEDNPSHQLLIQALLRRPQVSLTTADSAAEFFGLLERERFDCIVMDFELPDGSAEDLLSLSRDKLGDCPIIVISGFHNQEVVVSVMRLGGFDFLNKDMAFAGDMLWKRVELAVASGRVRRLERRKIQRRELRLVQHSETDPLTGLANRHYLDRIMLEERDRPDQRRHMATVLIDIDHFKAVNDSFGHAAGDVVLKAVASCVRELLKPGDVLVRWGGEEILVLRTSRTLLDGWLWTERVRRAVESLTVVYKGGTIPMTISGGVHQSCDEQFSEATIHAADKAMYLAKNRGRNQVCTAAMADLATELGELRLRDDLNPRRRWEVFTQRQEPETGEVQWQHMVPRGQRVSALAAEAGRRVHLQEKEIECIRMAGLMHDIGYCLIPEELAARRGALSPEETMLVHLHDRHGAWIAQEMGFDPSILEAIRHHHVRFDEVLPAASNAGNAPLPPITAHVLCAAAALVAMTSDCPYAPRRSIDDAFSELERVGGTQFDPYLVQALFSSNGEDRLLAA